MGAIDILTAEHRVIERGIDALVAFADEVRRGAEDKAELGRFVAFIRGFADAHHHGKEEKILFEQMIRAGFPREGGPIAVMLMEHDAGRAEVRRLADAAEKAGPWTEADRHAVAEAAAGYAGLLRAHIQKEDAILYPMAEQRLPPGVMEEVDEACDAYEEREREALARLRALADELVGRHAAALPAPPRGHGG